MVDAHKVISKAIDKLSWHIEESEDIVEAIELLRTLLPADWYTFEEVMPHINHKKED